MSKRRTKHSLEERVQAVRQIIEDHQSIHRVATDYGIDRKTLQVWVRNYQAEGLDGLKEARTWKHYPAELKLVIIPRSQVHLSRRVGLWIAISSPPFRISSPLK